MMFKRMFMLTLSLFLIAGATAALASEGGDRQGQARHCVVQVTSAETEQPEVLGCYDSFSEAISVATDGTITLPESVMPGEVTQEMLAPSRPISIQSSTVIGIDYEWSYFSGSTVTYTTENPDGCYDGSVYKGTMPFNWNDDVSSAKSYQGCAHFYHYEHDNYSGSLIDCGYQCETMGVMNDETSSEKLCRWCSS